MTPDKTKEDLCPKILKYLYKGGNLASINRISETSLESVYHYAYYQYQNSCYDKALKSFQVLCYYDQWNPRYFLALGASQKTLKLYDQAIKTLSYAAMLDSSSPLPVIYTADCYLMLGDKEKATNAYKEAMNIAKKNGVENKETSRVENYLEQETNSGDA